jgi:hypothetical protein
MIKDIILGVESPYTVSGSSAGDKNWDKVSLLLNGDDLFDHSSNTKTISNTLTTVNNATKKFGSGSLSFSSLATMVVHSPSDNLINWFSGGTYTFECWVYPTSITDANSGGSLVGNGCSDGSNGYNYWSFGPKSDGRLGLYYYTGGLNNVYSNSTIPFNAWTHIAFTCDGTNIKFWINGNLDTNTTIVGSPQISNAANTGDFSMGRLAAGVFSGYVDDVRITKGIDRYTANFTPPTAALPTSMFVADSSATPVSDPNTSKYVSLLLNGDGTNGSQNNTFIDGSVNNVTITKYGDATQGSFSPFGNSWSVYFDGNGDYLSLQNSVTNQPGNGDFTIECWVNVDYISSYQIIFCKGEGITSGEMFFAVTASGYIVLYNPSVTSSNTITPGLWNHVALVRQSGVIKIFVNGVGGTGVNDSTNFNSTSYFNLGDRNAGASYLNYPLKGAISNFRMVKGSALYTANFTPSTAPLVAVTGTTLLMCQSNGFIDNSSNNSLITVYGETKIIKSSPFPEIYDKNVHGGSVYFDGTGDYLSMPSSANYAFDTSDFTVEAWVNPATVGLLCVFQCRDTASNGMWLGLYNGNVFWYDSAIGTWSGTAVKLNSWTHLAWSRNSSTCRMFVNGDDVGVTKTSNANYTSTNAKISYDASNNGNYFNGYISNLRAVKGTALYTVNFTPGTSPLSQVSNTILLLKFDNAGIYDAIGKNDLITYGNSQISTTQKKYGTGAMYFDGSSYVKIPTSVGGDLDFQSIDFTIEFWANSPMSANQGWVDKWGSSSSRSVFIGYSNSSPSSGVNFNWTTNGTNWSAINSLSIPSANVWHHYAAIRNGNTLNFFIDGVSQGTASISGSIYSSSSPFIIGCNGETLGSSWYYTGYIDDLRIIKGKALYTANFTPPSAPLSL